MEPTRRVFLSSAVASVATLAANHRALGANERLGVAVVGVNGMGHFHVRTLAGRKDVRITLCDVDQEVLGRAAKTVQDATGATPATIDDFRRLLDDKSIQALVIATPCHWHCPMALMAFAANKD